MNRPSTEEIKRALRIARNNIQYHSEEFVCNALPNDEVGDYLRNYILNALGTKNPTVTFWIWRNVLNLSDEEYPFKEEMKAYRLRWIDWMMDQ